MELLDSDRLRPLDPSRPYKPLDVGEAGAAATVHATGRLVAVTWGNRRHGNSLLTLGEPVISVDTKKKELVGPFRNGGRELRPKGDPERVRMHDFLIPELGRASPYGVYDLAANEAWVSVGTDHDTAAFAVESIRRWWRTMSVPLYPDARRLLVTADAGGSMAEY